MAEYVVVPTEPELVISEKGMTVIHALEEVVVEVVVLVAKDEVVIPGTLYPAITLQVVLWSWYLK